MGRPSYASSINEARVSVQSPRNPVCKNLAYFHQKKKFRFIFHENYLFKIVNFYLKHNLLIFPFLEGVLGIFLEICFFVFFMFFKRLFAPTSQSRMSNVFRDSESLEKSNGKKWSQIWTFLFQNCQKSLSKKKFILLNLPYKTWWKPRFPMD